MPIAAAITIDCKLLTHCSFDASIALVMNTPENTAFFINPAHRLKELLIERQGKNRGYSARAFARDLGLSQAFLSQVLSGKRNLSLAQKLKLADALGFSLEQTEQHPKLTVIQSTLDHDKILRHWYHMAILEMSGLKNNPLSSEQIKTRLGISDFQVQDAIKRLKFYGYIEVAKSGRIRRTKTPLIFHSQKSTVGLRELHSAALKAGNEELSKFSEHDVSARAFQTLYVASSREKIAKAKTMLAEFNHKLLSFLTDSSQEEVFQFSSQLFSIEKNQKPIRKSKES